MDSRDRQGRAVGRSEAVLFAGGWGTGCGGGSCGTGWRRQGELRLGRKQRAVGRRSVVRAAVGDGRGTGRSSLRVGIAGAGIGGLTTALSLLSREGTGVESVKLFEPRSSVDFGLGGALNLTSGAVVLAKGYGLDLWSIARPVRRVLARQADGSPRGGNVLFDLDVRAEAMSSSEWRRALVHEDRVMAMTVMRDRLQSLLVDALPPQAEIERGKRVSGVVRNEMSGKFRFKFADGAEESEDFDLVVGADGICSAVRSYVSGQQTSPQYSGIRVQLAVGKDSAGVPVEAQIRNGALHQWFGDGGYVLHYGGGPDEKLTEILAFCFQSPIASRENVEYTSAAELREEFRNRLVDTGMPQHLQQACDRCERFIDTSVHYHSNLSSWARSGGCTLVGDSAHAMPPFLGQGGNQSIVDAHALAVALSRHGALPQALQAYERGRRGPTAQLIQMSRATGLLETQGGFPGVPLRDNLFRLAGTLGLTTRTFLGKAAESVPIDLL